MSIFEVLIEERKKKKVTQRKMAKHLKCMPATLNKYEKGTRKISSDNLEKYADFLGLEIKFMLK